MTPEERATLREVERLLDTTIDRASRRSPPYHALANAGICRCELCEARELVRALVKVSS